MSSSKSLFEDVKWALSNRKLGTLGTPPKKGLKMHKYAKRFSLKKNGKRAWKKDKIKNTEQLWETTIFINIIKIRNSSKENNIRRVLHTLKNMPRSTPMPKDTAATRATVHAVEHPWKRACASARNVVAP